MTAKRILVLCALASTLAACSSGAADDEGELRTEAIVGGTLLPKGYPSSGWLARPRIVEGERQLFIFCGAVYIGDATIVTAAHCLAGISIENVRFGVGAFDWSKGVGFKDTKGDLNPDPAFDGEPLNYDVYYHPRYSWDCGLHDLVVIHLASSVPDAQPATIVRPLEPDAQPSNDFNRRLIGYGRGTEGNSHEPTGGTGVRRSALQKIVSRTGGSGLPSAYPPGPARGLFRAQSPKTSSPCFGDSGSPLFVDRGNGTDGEIDRVVGITEGKPDGVCNLGDVSDYTSLAAHRTFIRCAAKQDPDARYQCMKTLDWKLSCESPYDGVDTSYQDADVDGSDSDWDDFWSDDVPGSGACSNQCTTPGEKRCSGGDGYEECGDFDGDGCLEWDGFSCASFTGTHCEEGYCVSGSTCTEGSKQCVDGDTYVECSGGTWSQPYSCSASWPGTLCSDGWCVN